MLSCLVCSLIDVEIDLFQIIVDSARSKCILCVLLSKDAILNAIEYQKAIGKDHSRIVFVHVHNHNVNLSKR